MVAFAPRAISWAVAPAGKGGAAGARTVTLAPSSGVLRVGMTMAAVTVSGRGADGGVLGVGEPVGGVGLALAEGLALGCGPGVVDRFGVGAGGVLCCTIGTTGAPGSLGGALLGTPTGVVGGVEVARLGVAGP